MSENRLATHLAQAVIEDDREAGIDRAQLLGAYKLMRDALSRPINTFLGHRFYMGFENYSTAAGDLPPATLETLDILIDYYDDTPATEEQMKQMVREALNKGGYPTFAHMMDEYYKNDYTIAGRMCWHRIQGMEEYAEERRDVGDVLDSFFITGRGAVYIVIAPEPPFFTNEIVTMKGEEYRVTGMEKKANYPEKGKNPYVFTGPIKDRLLQSILLSPIAAVEA